jgi:ABC-type uncharacterized transport system substrate-binding protein
MALTVRAGGRALGLAALLFSCTQLPAGSIVAVLSGNQVPYQEALEGLKTALGGTVDSAVLPDKPDLHQAKVVVTFGTQAALENYPNQIQIYALVPDESVHPGSSLGKPTRVEMLPEPEALAAHVLQLQPNLKTLAAINVNDGYTAFLGRLEAALAAKGVGLVRANVDSAGDLPAALRTAKDKAQGLWMPPEPLLLNLQNFNLATSFCGNFGIALYAPVASLAKLGALAGIAPGFKDVGAAAGKAAQARLAGGSESVVYPHRTVVALNTAAAAKAGVQFSAEAIKAADAVYP